MGQDQEKFDKWLEEMTFYMSFASETYKQIAEELNIEKYELSTEAYDVSMVFNYVNISGGPYSPDYVPAIITVRYAKYVELRTKGTIFVITIEDDNYINKLKEILKVSRYIRLDQPKESLCASGGHSPQGKFTFDKGVVGRIRNYLLTK